VYVKTVAVLLYANIIDKEVHAKTVEVVVYAYIRDKEAHAKTVEVVVFANIRDKKVHVKTVEVLLFASIKEEEIHAKNVDLSQRHMVEISSINWTHGGNLYRLCTWWKLLVSTGHMVETSVSIMCT